MFCSVLLCVFVPCGVTPPVAEQKRKKDANVGELIVHLTNIVHFWAHSPPSALPRASDSFESQQERSMATQTAGWLAKETSRLSLHSAADQAVPAQASARMFAVGGADAAKRDEFSQTAVAVGEWHPESGYISAAASASASAAAAPVPISRRAMKRMEREQRKSAGAAAPVASASSEAVRASAYEAKPVPADGPVVIAAAVVVGPQQWQQQLAEQQYQQKQLPPQAPLFQQQFQQQQVPEREAAGSLARFFKTAGHQQLQLQQRAWAPDSAPVSMLHQPFAAAAAASTPALMAAAAAPAYTRLQPPPLPVPHEAQDVWSSGGVWGGLGDLGNVPSSSNSSGGSKPGMMFVGDKQVESRSPAADALWSFGSGAGWRAARWPKSRSVCQ